MRIVKGRNLAPGMVLALPFNKTATIQSVKRGTMFMNFTTEHGPSRVELESEQLVEGQVRTFVLSMEEIDALIYACEDVGEVYSEPDEDSAIQEIGNIMLSSILPKLRNLKEHT